MGREAPGEVRLEVRGSVAHLSWGRPPLNVLDVDLLARLAEALRRDEVRSSHLLVLRGDRGVWSAGLSVEDHLAPKLESMLRAFDELLITLSTVPVPTLAVVDGPCLGGGLELLLACDLALASERATFGQPEVRLGVLPPAGLAGLVREVGPKHAADLLFTGRTVTAQEADRIGLVSRVVPTADLDAEADRSAAQLAALRRETLVAMKELWRAGDPFPWENMERAVATYLSKVARWPSADEGLRAFLEKRPPRWPVAGAAAGR